MGNLTRDPFRAEKGGNISYCKNMNKLKVEVDGKQLDSQFICNVYRTAHDRKPYCQVFQLGDDGKILEYGGQPVKVDVEGDIVITGSPRTCGCWRGKRVRNWWRNLNHPYRAGW